MVNKKGEIIFFSKIFKLWF